MEEEKKKGAKEKKRKRTQSKNIARKPKFANYGNTDAFI